MKHFPCIDALGQLFRSRKVSISNNSFICATWTDRQGNRNLIGRESIAEETQCVMSSPLIFEENHTKAKSSWREGSVLSK